MLGPCRGQHTQRDRLWCTPNGAHRRGEGPVRPSSHSHRKREKTRGSPLTLVRVVEQSISLFCRLSDRGCGQRVHPGNAQNVTSDARTAVVGARDHRDNQQQSAGGGSMAGNDRLNAPAVAITLSAITLVVLAQQLCPILGWGAPLSNTQPSVPVYMVNLWVNRAGSQWVLPAALYNHR